MPEYTKDDFLKDFPDDETCIEWLKNYRWSDGIFCKQCGKITNHYYIDSRKSYSCQECGHHVHPTADTIFHKSRTSLQLWFYAVYLVAAYQGNISAKYLEAELGVTYKTAWRMRDLICRHLYD